MRFNVPSLPCLVLPVETKARELHAKFYLACVAAERGFTVVLGRSVELKNRVPWLPVGSIYFDKSLDIRRVERFRAYRNLGLRVVSACEEGLVFINPEEYLKRRIHPKSLEHTECFFAWGGYQASIITQHVPQYANRVYEVGNPRIDLLSHPLRNIFDKSTRAIQAKYPNLILINTNFSFCNNKEGPGSFRQGMELSGRMKSNKEREFFQGWHQHKKKIFDAFVEMVPHLSERLDANIVIRPHPCEDHKTWQKISQGLKNVAVVYDDSVIPWLRAAKMILHNGCTTGLEGYLLGRAVVSFQPVMSDFDMQLPNAVSLSVSNLDDLVDCAGKALRDEPLAVGLDAEKTASRYIHNAPGKSSDAIVDILLKHRVNPMPLPLHLRLICPLRRLFWRSRAKFEQLTSAQLQKFPELTISEVKILLSGFQEITGRFQNLNITESWPGCVILLNQKQSTTAHGASNQIKR